MNVLAKESWSWILYEDGDRRILSVLVGTVALFDVNVELLPKERAAWEQQGAAGLAPLIQAIQWDFRRAIADRAQERFNLALSDFLLPGADPVALTERWRPQTNDYPRIFLKEMEAHARSTYDELWKQPEILRPEQGSDRVRADVATTEALIAGNSHFPDDWKTVAQRALNPMLAVAHWRFGLPSQTFGEAYDGLIDLGDHMVWFPKLHRLLR